MLEHNLTHLKWDNVITSLPVLCYSRMGVEKDLKKCPWVTQSSIFDLYSVSLTGELMSDLKSSEVYQYIHINEVRCSLFKE